MRIYLDVSCLNRPFDDQSQLRVKLEADAVHNILDNAELYGWRLVSSEMAVQEIKAMPDADRQRKVRAYLPSPEHIIELDEDILDRANVIAEKGVKEADAIHLAAAEAQETDIFLTCDDKLLKRARKLGRILNVEVDNPLHWMEQYDASIE